MNILGIINHGVNLFLRLTTRDYKMQGKTRLSNRCNLTNFLFPKSNNAARCTLAGMAAHSHDLANCLQKRATLLSFVLVLANHTRSGCIFLMSPLILLIILGFEVPSQLQQRSLIEFITKIRETRNEKT